MVETRIFKILVFLCYNAIKDMYVFEKLEKLIAYINVKEINVKKMSFVIILLQLEIYKYLNIRMNAEKLDK